jgi:homoserine O-acetyltransferase
MRDLSRDTPPTAGVGARERLGEFRFACGETIPDLEVEYETYGEFTGNNAVLVCHALTGSAHVAGHRGVSGDQARAWWDDIVGPGKAIDTTDYHVVCVNVPGSCYGTDGPPKENPETGEPYGVDFPPVTIEDWTESQRRLLDALGIPHLHAVVGGSVGGMNALDWAKRHPDHVDRVAAIAAAPRLDPQCLALDAIARRAITTDPDWQEGEYYGTDRYPANGLALARQIGHVMYLSKASMSARFGRRAAGRDAARDTFPSDPAADFFPYRDVESYLDYQASRFVERFDANSYLYLSRAMDHYDLAAGYDDDADALAAFDGEALTLSFTGDWHFPVEANEAVAEAFREANTPVAHHAVDSDHGHDAFLVEPEKVGPPLAAFLDEGLGAAPISDTREAATPSTEPSA